MKVIELTRENQRLKKQMGKATNEVIDAQKKYKTTLREAALIVALQRLEKAKA